MKVSVYSLAGDVVGEVELDETVFGVSPHMPVMHQAVVQHQANARIGTASAKTRAEVAGTTKKMYRQKGTGRARHGSRKVNLWTGGGVVHGPRPRSYEQHMPKKMRRLAIRSALSVKVRDGQLILIESLSFERPRTRAMVELLGRLPVNGKVLLTLDALDQNVVLSTRNIPNVHTLPATGLSTRDLIGHDYLIATVPAIREVERWLGTGPGDGDGEDDSSSESVVEAPTRRRRTARAASTDAESAPAEAAAVESSSEEAPAPRPRRARKSEAAE